MNPSIELHHVQQAARALESISRDIKARLMAGQRLVLQVKEATRSSDQNRLLHSALQDLAAQVVWHGQRLSADTWKRLCMAAWLREGNEKPMLVPALDGHGVDIVFEKTSKLTRSQCASLITWIHAFGDGQGVQWSPTSLGRDWDLREAA